MFFTNQMATVSSGRLPFACFAFTKMNFMLLNFFLILAWVNVLLFPNVCQVPDYYDIIKEPMDFGTIRNKIHAFAYHKPSEMLEDVRKIFKNCIEYNIRSSPEYKASGRLAKHFDKRIKEKCLSEDLPSPVKNSRGRVSVWSLWISSLMFCLWWFLTLWTPTSPTS